MSNARVRSAGQPQRRIILSTAALSLGAVMIGGAGVANAQEAGIDGTWTVDTSIGDISDGSSTFVGFRVDEVLDPGGEATAVGRTPDVRGQLDVAGTVIESFALEADLTSLATNNDFRNGAIQRTLATDQYPTASFVSTAPVDLGQVPAEGEVFGVSVPGTLTIKDVSQDIVVDLQAGLGGDRAVVVGSWPIAFGDFGVTMPSAPIVVSVEDNGLLEWQIFFAHEAEMTAEVTTDDEAADEEAAGDAVAEEDESSEE